MSETKSLTLDEAKARMEHIRRVAIEYNDLPRINCATDCIDLLARVEQPSEEDMAVLWLMKEFGWATRRTPKGRQDQEADPPEFVEVKGVESATFDQKQELAISAHSKLEVPAQEQEADGVEWLLYSEWATFDGRVAAVRRMKDGGWYWAAFYEDADVEECNGTALTRAEARAAAVEAARWMNNKERS